MLNRKLCSCELITVSIHLFDDFLNPWMVLYLISSLVGAARGIKEQNVLIA
jgi:hypothetical protein